MLINIYNYERQQHQEQEDKYNYFTNQKSRHEFTFSRDDMTSMIQQHHYNPPYDSESIPNAAVTLKDNNSLLSTEIGDESRGFSCSF